MLVKDDEMWGEKRVWPDLAAPSLWGEKRSAQLAAQVWCERRFTPETPLGDQDRRCCISLASQSNRPFCDASAISLRLSRVT